MPLPSHVLSLASAHVNGSTRLGGTIRCSSAAYGPSARRTGSSRSRQHRALGLRKNPPATPQPCRQDAPCGQGLQPLVLAPINSLLAIGMPGPLQPKPRRSEAVTERRRRRQQTARAPAAWLLIAFKSVWRSLKRPDLLKPCTFRQHGGPKLTSQAHPRAPHSRFTSPTCSVFALEHAFNPNDVRRHEQSRRVPAARGLGGG